MNGGRWPEGGAEKGGWRGSAGMWTPAFHRGGSQGRGDGLKAWWRTFLVEEDGHPESKVLARGHGDIEHIPREPAAPLPCCPP